MFSNAIACVSSMRPARPQHRLQLRHLRVRDGHRLRGHRIGIGERDPLDGLVERAVHVVVHVLAAARRQARRGAAASCRSRRTTSTPRRWTTRYTASSRIRAGRTTAARRYADSLTIAGPEQLAVVAGHGERVRARRRPPSREPVRQPSEHPGLSRGHRGNASHSVLLGSSSPVGRDGTAVRDSRTPWRSATLRTRRPSHRPGRRRTRHRPCRQRLRSAVRAARPPAGIAATRPA